MSSITFPFWMFLALWLCGYMTKGLSRYPQSICFFMDLLTPRVFHFGPSRWIETVAMRGLKFAGKTKPHKKANIFRQISACLWSSSTGIEKIFSYIVLLRRLYTCFCFILLMTSSTVSAAKFLAYKRRAASSSPMKLQTLLKNLSFHDKCSSSEGLTQFLPKPRSNDSDANWADIGRKLSSTFQILRSNMFSLKCEWFSSMSSY